jgi:hypothetical protein
MNLQVSIKPEDNSEGIDLNFNVPIPDKHVNILKEGSKLIFAVTEAITKIKDELKED